MFANGPERLSSDSPEEVRNLELVRSIYTKWAKGDFSDTAWAHPEIELCLPDGIEASVTFKGLAEVAEGWRSFLGAWDGLKTVPDEYMELDGGRILVTVRNQGRGRASGLDVETMWQESANLFELRDGKVTRLTAYWDAALARADAGLASGEG